MPFDYRTPTPAEQIGLTNEVKSLVMAVMLLLADRGGTPPASAEIAENETQYYLALLHAVGVLYGLLDLEEKHCAKLAAHYGAGYPELAEAWRVTRQGARRRWPDAVPGRDDDALRQALTKLIQLVSGNPTLDPRTAARLIGPITAAAGAMVSGSTDDVVAAATRILESAPPAPRDQGVLHNSLAHLGRVLEEFQKDPSAVLGETSSPWHRFLTARNQ